MLPHQPSLWCHAPRGYIYTNILFGRSHLFPRDTTRAAGGEAGRVEQERQQQAQEAAAWKQRVVVSDTTFHTRGLRRMRPGQLDRFQNLLQDPPQKLALRKCHAEAPLVSMFLGEPPGRGQCPGRESHPQLLVDSGVDFRGAVAKAKSAVHRPGMTQSWWGSLHDKHLEP